LIFAGFLLRVRNTSRGQFKPYVQSPLVAVAPSRALADCARITQNPFFGISISSGEKSQVRICVIGGSGFIGSRLVASLLAQEHEVTIFDRAPSVLFSDRQTLADVRDLSALKQALTGCECIVQLAAEHRDDVRPVSLYAEVNVGGAQNIADAAAANDVPRIVFVSTAAVYGLGAHDTDEAAAVAPQSPYSQSKVRAEEIFTQWQRDAEQSRMLEIIRPVVVFGEGNRGNVHNLIEQIRRHRFIMVGKGQHVKSIAYVENVVDFIVTRLERAPGIRIHNYADKPDYSVVELVALIRRELGQSRSAGLSLPVWLGLAAGYGCDLVSAITGRALPINSDRVRKFCADTSVSTNALASAGFVPRYSIAEGFARMIKAIDDTES
jgi:GlcNAc-P-P-Und epimerase